MIIYITKTGEIVASGNYEEHESKYVKSDMTIQHDGSLSHISGFIENIKKYEIINGLVEKLEPTTEEEKETILKRLKEIDELMSEARVIIDFMNGIEPHQRVKDLIEEREVLLMRLRELTI